MSTYQFKTPPKISDTQIPFALTSKAFKKWLDSLSTKPDNEQAHQILLAIQAINTESSLLPEKKSALLIGIYQETLVFLKPLKNNILNSALPLTSEELCDVEHIVWIYAELANSFEHCMTKKSNATNAVTFYFGIQSLITAYLYISAVYEAPYANFWKQSYLFYGTACQLNLHDLSIDLGEQRSSTVSHAFKHLIALYHCDLHQFRPRTILQVSSCIEKHTSSMLLDTKFSEKRSSLYSALNLNSDLPPTHLNRLDKTEKKALRFFHGFNAAAEIFKYSSQEAQGNGTLKLINNKALLQAAKSLSQSKKRRFTRLSENRDHDGIIGLDNIIQTLRHDSSLVINQKKKKRNGYQTTSGGWSVPDLNLVSEGYESIDAMKALLSDEATTKSNTAQAKHLMSISSRDEVWPSKHTTSAIMPTTEAPLSIIDSSIKGYKIELNLTNSNIRVQLGDIIGLKNKNSYEIGIIHRATLQTKDKVQLNIKLLSFESELTYLSTPKNDSVKTWALLLPSNKAPGSADSVIFNDSHFKCGEYIFLNRADTKPHSYKLQKLLHINSAASHIELLSAPIIGQ